MNAPLVLVHGGAGTLEPQMLLPCVEGCERAAAAGYEAIDSGALEAVIAAVVALEQDPSFNAGLGSTLTSDGTVELDAAVMTGDLRFGGVGACPPVASAIRLARAVMERSEHVLLVGEGAAELARSSDIDLLGPQDLIVPRAVEALERHRRAIADGGALLPPGGGTVGAVAIDRAGGLASATSTGGVLNKRRGRVGDTPIPGGGTYADARRGVAASATGRGEAIMRVLLCRRVAELVGEGKSIEAAGRLGLSELAELEGGFGGVIALDRTGRFFQGKNTVHMPWASRGAAGSASGA